MMKIKCGESDAVNLPKAVVLAVYVSIRYQSKIVVRCGTLHPE